MAGQLDAAFKKIAKQVVSQLGVSLDNEINLLKAPLILNEPVYCLFSCLNQI